MAASLSLFRFNPNFTDFIPHAGPPNPKTPRSRARAELESANAVDANPTRLREGRSPRE